MCSCCRPPSPRHFPTIIASPSTIASSILPKGNGPTLHNMPYWISSATLAGLPATVAPVGRTEAGLPVGIQIIAPMWEDGTSIEFAALLSDLVGGFTAPSAFRE